MVNPYRKSRRCLKGYLVAGSPTEELFALLIKSGAIYCTIWVSCLLVARPASLFVYTVQVQYTARAD